MAHWNHITSEEDLQAIEKASFASPQIVFKHSTRCGISSHVWATLQNASSELEGKGQLHYLDLLTYRPLSNKIAHDWNVLHQSPQVIVLKEGKAIHHSSHFAVNAQKILNACS